MSEDEPGLLTQASLGTRSALPGTTGLRQAQEHETSDSQALVLGAEREASPCKRLL